MLFQSGPVENLETYDGATVVIDQLDEVEILSIRDPVTPEYAEPAD
jgi:hypothetical protein